MKNIPIRDLALKIESETLRAVVELVSQSEKSRVTGICGNCLVSAILDTVRALDEKPERCPEHAQDSFCEFSVNVGIEVGYQIHEQYGQEWLHTFLRSSAQYRENTYVVYHASHLAYRYLLSTFMQAMLGKQWTFIMYLAQATHDGHNVYSEDDCQHAQEWIDAQHSQYMRHGVYA